MSEIKFISLVIILTLIIPSCLHTDCADVSPIDSNDKAPYLYPTGVSLRLSGVVNTGKVNLGNTFPPATGLLSINNDDLHVMSSRWIMSLSYFGDANVLWIRLYCM